MQLMRRAAPIAFGGLALALVALSAKADGPILHERVPVDLRESIALGERSGNLPAAVQSGDGVIPAPDPKAPPAAGEAVYPGDNPGVAGDVDTFVPDRDTRSPGVLPYDDPFRPSIAPFKRMSAFDAVDADYKLFVSDRAKTPFPVSKRPIATDGSEDTFYADLSVRVGGSGPAKIPSVGPGARIVAAQAYQGDRPIGVQFFRDGAENWFVSSTPSGTIRLTMQLGIRRAAFGGPFLASDWSMLPRSPRLPGAIQPKADRVARHIGVSRRLPPRDVVQKLTQYFRGFRESTDPPKTEGDIYLDLALSKKGVCRHRAFAFLVTALGLGLPARMVVNEAHAWVEVHDGRAFQRIDLGGAASGIESSSRVYDKPYEPPDDPFAWPKNATRGSDMPGTRPKSSGGGSGGSGGSGSGGTDPGSDGPSAFDPSAPPGPDPTIDESPSTNPSSSVDPGVDDELPTDRTDAPEDASNIELHVDAHELVRGSSLDIRGRVARGARACSGVVVHFALESKSRARNRIELGATATDESGAFVATLRVGQSVELGRYRVVATSEARGACGAGRSP